MAPSAALVADNPIGSISRHLACAEIAAGNERTASLLELPGLSAWVYSVPVRRIILAGTGPEGGDGIANLPQVVAEGQQATPAEPRLFLFFDRTESSQRAGRAFITRQRRRTTERDQDSTEQTVAAQLEAIVRWGGSPTADAAVRLQHISQPVLVVNGKSDVMVPTINSLALFQQLPNARLSLP